MIVAVAGGKGAPGATALAALLASAWPSSGNPCVLVEADPDGGVLAARWHRALHVTHDPGLLSLAAAREGSALERLLGHGQAIGAGVRLIAGPPGATQAGACLLALGEGAPEALRDAPVTCVVDCGRLHPASPALPWAAAASRVLLVTRPRLDEVVALPATIERLAAVGVAPELVCVGDGPFTPADVAEHAGVPLLGVVADDPAVLAALFAQGPSARRVVRSRVVRSVRALIGPLVPAGGDAGGEERAGQAEEAGAVSEAGPAGPAGRLGTDEADRPVAGTIEPAVAS